MKKKVLHLIPSFHQGGSERQAVQLARLLRGDGSYDLYLACLDAAGVLKGQAADLGFTDVPEFRLTSFYGMNMARQLRRFVAYLRTNRIDIVQTHDFYSNIFGIAGARLANVPVRIAAKRETGMRTSAQKFVERRAFATAQAVVVNSERVKQYLADAGVSNEKLQVVYNGIDHEKYAVCVEDRAKVLKELGLPTGRPLRFVTIVANLRDRVKNQRMFLRAAAAVAEQVDDAGFILAGEGELLEETKAFSKKLGLTGRTFFLGRCLRIPELLALSEVCVLTSESEGFSNSLLEYMAAGKPVVATDVGGAAEAILEDTTGFLVASDDDSALADRLCRLLNDEHSARQMGRAGKRWVIEKFSMNAQLEGTLSIYERELGRVGRN